MRKVTPKYERASSAFFKLFDLVSRNKEAVVTDRSQKTIPGYRYKGFTITHVDKAKRVLILRGAITDFHRWSAWKSSASYA